MSSHLTADVAVEKLLHKRAANLEKALTADVATYVGQIVDGVDHAFRDALEPRKKRRPKLAIVLDTVGGFIEVAERTGLIKDLTYQVLELGLSDLRRWSVSAGRYSRTACLRTYLPVLPRSLSPGGHRLPSSTIRWSRKGGRISSEFCIDIRSVLTRMSSGK